MSKDTYCHKHPERGPVKMVVIKPYCPVCRGQQGGKKTLATHGVAKLKRWGKQGGRPTGQ